MEEIAVIPSLTSSNVGGDGSKTPSVAHNDVKERIKSQSSRVEERVTEKHPPTASSSGGVTLENRGGLELANVKMASPFPSDQGLQKAVCVLSVPLSSE